METLALYIEHRGCLVSEALEKMPAHTLRTKHGYAVIMISQPQVTILALVHYVTLSQHIEGYGCHTDCQVGPTLHAAPSLATSNHESRNIQVESIA